MTLGVWMFNWSWPGAAPSGTATAEVALTLPTAGGGGPLIDWGQSVDRALTPARVARKYEPLGDAYWLVRERYLRRLARVEPVTQPVALQQHQEPQPAPRVRELPDLLHQHALLTALVRTAANRAAMQAAASRLVGVQLQIRTAARQRRNYTVAITLLLLDTL